MTESNKRVCKNCSELKVRTEAGKFNKKDKKWVDENGKLWNGSLCPSCVVVKNRMRWREANAIKKA